MLGFLRQATWVLHGSRGLMRHWMMRDEMSGRIGIETQMHHYQENTFELPSLLGSFGSLNA